MPDPITRTDRFDLRALYETSRLLSASLDLEFVLNNLLLTAMSKLLVTRGAAFLYDPVEGAYRVASAKGISKLEQGRWMELSFEDDGRVLRGDDVPEALQAYGIELVLPVASAHRRIGLVGLGAKATKQPFEARELEFIHSLVNMSSAAVHNSLMVEELKQANRDLEAKIQQLDLLFGLAQDFNSALDRDRLVKMLSFTLMGQMMVTKHLFMMKTSDAPVPDDVPPFEVIASSGLRGKELEPALIRSLCEVDELLVLEDAPEDAWAGLRERGLVLAVPIRQQDETCGLLCLGPKMTRKPYTPDDIDLLHALGNLAFVSITNTYLVEEQIEKERLQEEMRLARDIQERLLPLEVPSVDGLQLARIALPSRAVGGDYFDLIALDDDRLLTAIADVTGKGVPASLLMANLQACLHTMVPMDLTLEEATGHINRVICGNTTYDKFITFFVGIYHRETGRYDYVNAGHNPPMLLRSDGTMELLETGGLLLGVMAGMPYERGTVTLNTGDVLAIFTDGVTEAMSPGKEEYGEERLEAQLRAHQYEPAQDILDAIYDDIKAFTHNPSMLSDDLTMIVVKVR